MVSVLIHTHAVYMKELVIKIQFALKFFVVSALLSTITSRQNKFGCRMVRTRSITTMLKNFWEKVERFDQYVQRDNTLNSWNGEGCHKPRTTEIKNYALSFLAKGSLKSETDKKYTNQIFNFVASKQEITLLSEA